MLLRAPTERRECKDREGWEKPHRPSSLASTPPGCIRADTRYVISPRLHQVYRMGKSIFKHLKKGTPGAIVTTEIEFNLGMRVENEFHNETIIVGNEGGRRGNLQEIKGNKMMRYFQDAEMPDGRLVKKQILISKFEMIGVRDNYQRNTAFQCDFDDPEPEEAVEEENYDGFSHVSKKRKSPLSASKPSSLSFDSSGPTIHGGRVPSSPNASAIRSAKVAAAQA